MNQRTMNWRKLGWILGIMAAAFLILLTVINNGLSAKTQEENSLRVTLTRLEEANKEMEAELKQVDTEEYIVTSAMTNYAFMNKNDLRFQFTNPEALYAYTQQEIEILMNELAD